MPRLRQTPDERKAREQRRIIKESMAASEARANRVLRGLPAIETPPKPPKVDIAGNADGKTIGGKEVLVIEQGELPKVAETLRDIIAKSNVFFDRGGPVRITKRAGSKLPIASALTTHGVVRAAHQLCRPIKDAAYATLPDRVAALYLDMAGEWKLPPLVAISAAPILGNDGSIRSAEGYDKDTGIYCTNVPQLNVPQAPTRAQAAESLLMLRHDLPNLSIFGCRARQRSRHRRRCRRPELTNGLRRERVHQWLADGYLPAKPVASARSVAECSLDLRRRHGQGAACARHQPDRLR